MTTDPRVHAFLAAIEAEDGYPGLSEAKMATLGDDRRTVVIAEGDDVVAVGVVARHAHADGSSHAAIETAVARSMAFPAFEGHVLSQALDTAPEGPVSVWSRRVSLDRALETAGFAARRSLNHMAVDLPLAATTPGLADRSLDENEIDDLVRINNAAFASHREAGTLTTDDVHALREEPWFSLEGIRVLGATELRAFCWTKVHPNGDGEIYRIAVDPAHQGQGLGREALYAGYRHLASIAEVQRGTLWVDAANTGAMRLYESIGMRIVTTNREFEKV